MLTPKILVLEFGTIQSFHWNLLISEILREATFFASPYAYVQLHVLCGTIQLAALNPNNRIRRHSNRRCRTSRLYQQLHWIKKSKIGTWRKKCMNVCVMFLQVAESCINRFMGFVNIKTYTPWNLNDFNIELWLSLLTNYDCILRSTINIGNISSSSWSMVFYGNPSYTHQCALLDCGNFITDPCM